MRPLLLVDGYDTTVSPLKPGTQFVLSLRIRNAGSAAAHEATLVLGGGSAGGPSGTPGSAGVSGAGGNFQTFAPIGSSNVQYLADLATGGSITTSMHLIVNNTTTPGAYPLTLSLIYIDPGGMRYTDDHVITLLVYSPPFIEVNFYQPPEALFAGQPGTLPLQVVNPSAQSGDLAVRRCPVLAMTAVAHHHRAAGVRVMPALAGAPAQEAHANPGSHSHSHHHQRADKKKQQHGQPPD